MLDNVFKDIVNVLSLVSSPDLVMFPKYALPPLPNLALERLPIVVGMGNKGAAYIILFCQSSQYALT